MSTSIEAPREATVCRRRSFGAVLATPLGVFMVLVSLLSFGLPLVVMAVTHFVLMPGRLWVRDGRLYATKALPRVGIPLDAVEWTVLHQKMLFATVNRAVRLRAVGGEGRLLALNEVYFGRAAIDRLVAVLAEAEHHVPVAR